MGANGHCAKIYCDCMDGCYCDPCVCRGPNGETG